jgi:hypothetical protein
VAGSDGGRLFSYNSGAENQQPVVTIQNGLFDIDANGKKFASGEPTLLKFDLNNPAEATAFLARATNHCPKPAKPIRSTQASTTSVVSTTTQP